MYTKVAPCATPFPCNSKKGMKHAQNGRDMSEDHSHIYTLE